MRFMSIRLSSIIISLLLMFITTYAYSDTTPTPTPETTETPTPIETPTFPCDIPEYHCDIDSRMLGDPYASTGSATNITEYSATLNGKACNPTADSWVSTYAYFTYWEIGGTFTTTEQVFAYGCSNLTSIDVNDLKPSTVYFYFINTITSMSEDCCDRCHDVYNGWTSCSTSATGEIKTFSTAPILPDKGSIAGHINEDDYHYYETGVAYATIRIIGRKTRIDIKTTSDENGYFAFNYLDPDNYLIIVTKKGYKRSKERVGLEAGENEYTEIELKKL